jgi:hypothetical protein
MWPFSETNAAAMRTLKTQSMPIRQRRAARNTFRHGNGKPKLNTAWAAASRSRRITWSWSPVVTMLEALEDNVKRQKKRLSARPTIDSPKARAEMRAFMKDDDEEAANLRRPFT